ncbi:MAG: hypothetical protein GYB31_11600 [Bacteroidetes bacterium]|nr:hypothetical protein [Bacteroidota bacterium]
MEPKPGASYESQLFEQLKEIILRDDRIVLEELKAQLNDPKLLEQRVGPLIESQLEVLRQNFPDTYYKVVDNIVQTRLRTSQDEILDTIYPVMGKMIRKYIQKQIASLRREMSEQIYQTFNSGVPGRIRFALFGMSRRDKKKMFARAKMQKVEEAFVVEQHSGILLGSASKGETIDRDLIAGMLTAIKSFVEDAFKKGDKDLEQINYGDYSIHIFNNYNCYISVVVGGSLLPEEREFMEERIQQFAENKLLSILRGDENARHLQLRKGLEDLFFPEPKIRDDQ